MRVFLAVLGYTSALVGLPWIAGLCIVALSVRYRAWEAILLGFIMDLLWLPTTQVFFPLFTVGALVTVWVFEPLRTQFLH